MNLFYFLGTKSPPFHTVIREFEETLKKLKNKKAEEIDEIPADS